MAKYAFGFLLVAMVSHILLQSRLAVNYVTLTQRQPNTPASEIYNTYGLVIRTVVIGDKLDYWIFNGKLSESPLAKG